MSRICVHFVGKMHRKHMNKTLLVALGLTFAACSSREASPDTAVTQVPADPMPRSAESKLATPEEDAAPPTTTEPAPDQTPEPPAVTSPKIIRNAQIRFRVADFAASGRAIEQAVRQTGGQIAGSNETKSDNSIENQLTVRVPAARLDAFLTLVLKQSIYTDTKTITAEDVTRRYVDTEARIRSKKAVEETYLNLLKKARTVEDVLKVEEQLAQIREERKVQEAELRQLKDEVALSTVNLTYYQQTEAALRPEEPFYRQIAHNFADGLRLVGSVLVGVFYFVPLGLIVAGVVWLVMRWRRQRSSPR